MKPLKLIYYAKTVYALFLIGQSQCGAVAATAVPAAGIGADYDDLLAACFRYSRNLPFGVEYYRRCRNYWLDYFYHRCINTH